MKAKFFYLVKGEMFRSKGSDTNPVIVNEVFVEDSPISAREKAFNCYHNYIDVFLESKGLKYISQEETKKALKDFFCSYTPKFAEVPGVFGVIAPIDVNFNMGLSIYLVMADTGIYTSVEGEVIYEDKHLIHYISSQRLDFRLNLFASLLYEFSLFEKYGYDFKSYRRNYCVAGQDKGNSIKRILETPIDFTEVLKEKYGV